MEEPGLSSIKSGSQLDLWHKEKLDEFFKSLPADTLSLHVFSEEELKSKGWETIRAEYRVLKDLISAMMI